MNGKKEAEKILKSLKRKIAQMPAKPGLAAVLVGNDSASQLYVSLKEKKAAEIRVGFKKFLLPANVSEKKIINLIQKLNQDKKITGILVQLPLPKKFNTEKIISAIDVRKDVDGFKLISNEQRVMSNEQQKKKVITPPTIQAVLHLIKMTKIKLSNKKAVILANSLEFSEPLKKELKRYKIKVDIILFCHSRPASWCGVNSGGNPMKENNNHEIPAYAGMTKGLNNFEIIIIALGKKHFLKPEMVKKDAVIVDVGINRVGKKIFGDVHPDCFKKSKYISPVPGGVGPLTVAYLFKNLLQLKNK